VFLGVLETGIGTLGDCGSRKDGVELEAEPETLESVVVVVVVVVDIVIVLSEKKKKNKKKKN
jgi:hypothetical protein